MKKHVRAHTETHTDTLGKEPPKAQTRNTVQAPLPQAKLQKLYPGDAAFFQNCVIVHKGVHSQASHPPELGWAAWSRSEERAGCSRHFYGELWTPNQLGVCRGWSPGCWSSLGGGCQAQQRLESVIWARQIEQLHRGVQLLVKRGSCTKLVPLLHRPLHRQVQGALEATEPGEINLSNLV